MENPRDLDPLELDNKLSDAKHPVGEDRPQKPSYEDTDLTRSEYITALVHFYRGELHRATMWRVRLDTTTNWSIISVMGLVTFSLGDPTHSHVGILAGMILVFTFLTIEARRFRLFDVWRARARMLEQNFMGPILRRDLHSPIEGWGRLVADDLLRPKLKMTWHQALRARLVRNYIPLFLLLAVCWVIKLSMVIRDDDQLAFPIFQHMKISQLPWWLVLVGVASLYGYLIGVVIFAGRSSAPEEEYWGDGANQSKMQMVDLA